MSLVFAVAYYVDGPPWLVATLAVLTATSLGGFRAHCFFSIWQARLFYLTWGTWWLLAPAEVALRHARYLREPAAAGIAVGPFRRLADVVEPEHPDRAAYLERLCEGLVLLTDLQVGDHAELTEEAVHAGRTALELTSPDDAALADRLHVLSAALLHRYAVDHDRKTLAEALRHARQATMQRPHGRRAADYRAHLDRVLQAWRGET